MLDAISHRPLQATALRYLGNYPILHHLHHLDVLQSHKRFGFPDFNINFISIYRLVLQFSEIEARKWLSLRSSRLISMQCIDVYLWLHLPIFNLTFFPRLADSLGSDCLVSEQFSEIEACRLSLRSSHLHAKHTYLWYSGQFSDLTFYSRLANTSGSR
jgi:hypothetical protein